MSKRSEGGGRPRSRRGAPAPGRPKGRRPLGEPWHDESPETRPPPPPPFIEAADRLHSAAIHLLRRLRREDDASGLTSARLSALGVVASYRSIRLGELAAAERVRPASMSRLVAGLQSEGLVRRRADPRDGRVLLVEATDEGRRILAEGRRRRVDALARELAELPPEDWTRFEMVLDVLEMLGMPDEHPTQLG